MKFVLLEDLQLITATITHPSIYKHVCDASSPDADQFEPRVSDKIFYIGVIDDEENYCGLFMVEFSNYALGELHTCILPIAWGQKANKIAKDFLKYLFNECSELKTLITRVPDDNRLALAYAKRNGMKLMGYIPDAYLNHTGELMGFSILGVQRHEVVGE